MSLEMNSIKNEIISDLIEHGYNKEYILNGINEVNKRLIWNINSFCLVYSRKNKQWFNSQITDKMINKKTNQEWLSLKYNNNKNTKKMQRFNQCIKSIDSPDNINHKIIQFISNKLKIKNNKKNVVNTKKK
eukprot:100520_1